MRFAKSEAPAIQRATISFLEGNSLKVRTNFVDSFSCTAATVAAKTSREGVQVMSNLPKLGQAAVHGVVVDISSGTFTNKETKEEVDYYSVVVAVGRQFINLAPDNRTGQRRLFEAAFKPGQVVLAFGKLQPDYDNSKMKLSNIDFAAEWDHSTSKFRRLNVSAEEPADAIDPAALARAQEQHAPTAEGNQPRRGSIFGGSKAAA